MSASSPPTCAFCGERPPGADEDPGGGAGRAGGASELPLTWTTGVENGRTRVFCDRCSRENLRAIEGKLDSEWW